MTHTPAGANADTAEMIAARQRVLGAGLFRDLDARLAEVLTDRDRICLLYTSPSPRDRG